MWEKLQTLDEAKKMIAGIVIPVIVGRAPSATPIFMHSSNLLGS
jgi:hypothetical protein